jgi:hypothetical protein
MTVENNGVLPGLFTVKPNDISADHILYEFYAFISVYGGQVYKT